MRQALCQGNVSDGLEKKGLLVADGHPAWSAAGGRHPPRLRTGRRAGNEPSQAADLNPQRRPLGCSGPQLKPGTSVGAAWGQATDSPADICLRRSVLAADSGWGRPLQAADCRPGGGREGGRAGGGSFYSKQTNKLFCFKKPKRKKKERKRICLCWLLEEWQEPSGLVEGRRPGARHAEARACLPGPLRQLGTRLACATRLRP